MEFNGSSSLILSSVISAAILLGTFLPGTVGEPRVQVSVVTNPISADETAIIQCQTWDVPVGEIVVIEFERSGRRPEILLRNGKFKDSVGDNFYYTKEVMQTDGSTLHSLSISFVHRFNAGTYRCKLGQQYVNGEFSTTTNGTVYLDVIHFPSEIYPVCHIVGFDKGLSRAHGSDVAMGCTSEYGSPRVSLNWISSGNRYVPPPEVISNGALYSEIRVTLSQADNGVAFICNARIPDSNKNYSSSCLIGPFIVTSGAQPQPTLPPVLPVTTRMLPTPVPNTRVVISAPGNPFAENDNAIVKCQVWELASNYIVSFTRMTSGGTETLVYNGALLDHMDSNFEFEISQPQDDGSTIFTLTIIQVHRSDSGTYSCSVYRPTGDNTYAIKTSEETLVEVINRPTTEPPAAANVALTISSPVPDGNRAYIQCLVTGLIGGGDVVISIESDTATGLGTLAHNGELSVSAARANNIFLVVQDNSVIDGTLSYFLSINGIRRSNAGSYICNVKRSSGSEAIIASDSKDLMVMSNSQPADSSQSQPPDVNPITLPVETRVTLGAQDDLVEEDGQAVLICQIWGLETNQAINIERSTLRGTELIVQSNSLKDGVRDYVFLTPRGQEDGSVIYYLTMRFVAASESGTYTCYAKQRLGTNSYLIVASDEYYLNVLVPTPPPPTPPPRATVPPTGTRVIVTVSANPAYEGTTVFFQCHIYELFRNHIVAIKRSTARGSETLVYNNEVPFAVADNFFVSILPQSDGSTIYYMINHDIHRSDTGTYSCTIYDTFGSISRTIVTMGSVELDVAYLPVKVHPVCTLTSATSNKILTPLKYTQGDEVNITCSSGFGKPRVGVHWSSDKDTNTTQRGSFKIIDDQVYSELSIQLNKISHNDATFTCSITSTAYSSTGRECTIGPFIVSGAPPLLGGLGSGLYVAVLLVSVLNIVL